MFYRNHFSNFFYNKILQTLLNGSQIIWGISSNFISHISYLASLRSAPYLLRALCVLPLCYLWLNDLGFILKICKFGLKRSLRLIEAVMRT